jgi:hypothetical protein
MAMRDRDGQSGRSAISAFAAPANAHLTYHGGKVIQNVQVTPVRYGAGTYAPELTSTTGVNMVSAYFQMVSSGVFDWLSEYNTTSPAQTIGRGSVGSMVQITPATSRNNSTISDANIQAEIAAQINASALPQPNNNQIYMVHFPSGKTITDGNTSSCVGGGFCAYHGTFKIGAQNVYYAVLPALDGGCATGCGIGTTFENMQSVTSHELIEAITDPEVGLTSSIGPPLAWYDNNNGEIGDICNHQHATFTGTDGNTYTIQQEFSNAKNDCIMSRSAKRDNDILWRDTDGTVAIWLMNGPINVEQRYPGKPRLDWTIQGTGDFNGDGKRDILWRDTDGTVAIWFMNGGTIVSQAFPTPTPGVPPGLDWTIQRVGDFNRDGKSDILFRDTDGTVAIWFMNGGTILNQAFPTPTPGVPPGLDWTIQGTGDFNHDGKSDILWRDTDGTVSIWFMDGGTLAAQAYPGDPGLDWSIHGVDAFD